MACSTPVTALPTGATSEVILPLGGLVAESINPSSLAEAVRGARTVPRQEARAQAEFFDEQVMVLRYLDEMETLARNRREGRAAPALRRSVASPEAGNLHTEGRIDISAGEETFLAGR